METQPKIWQRLKSEIIADCRVFNVRRDLSIDSDGNQHNFFVLENPAWVNVIPMTKNGEVVLIEQYRHGIDEITLEIPGGMVDEDEDVTEAAKRELVEETGYVPREMILLGKSRPNPAIQNNWVYHYLATDCEKTQEPEFDSTESVVTKLVALNEIPNLIRDEKITHSLVLACFHKLSLHQNL